MKAGDELPELAVPVAAGATTQAIGSRSRRAAMPSAIIPVTVDDGDTIAGETPEFRPRGRWRLLAIVGAIAVARSRTE